MLQIYQPTLAKSLNSITERTVGVTKSVGVDSHAYRQRAAKRSYENKLQQKRAVDQIGRMPDPGETIHMVVSAAYRTVDLIPAWLELMEPEPIQELYIATLSYNRGCLDLLLELFDLGRIGAISLVISIYDKANEPARFEYAKAELHKRGGRIMAMQNHCKVIAAKFACGTCYTSEGSANLRSHSTTENVALTCDPGLFEFHKGWMEEGLALPEHEKRKPINEE